MNTLTSGNIRMLQHIDDAARVGEVVLGETGVIRRGLSDLALRIGGSATFDGNVSIQICMPLQCLANNRHGSFGSSLAKISHYWIP